MIYTGTSISIQSAIYKTKLKPMHTCAQFNDTGWRREWQVTSLCRNQCWLNAVMALTTGDLSSAILLQPRFSLTSCLSPQTQHTTAHGRVLHHAARLICDPRGAGKAAPCKKLRCGKSGCQVESRSTGAGFSFKMVPSCPKVHLQVRAPAYNPTSMAYK